MTDDDPDRSDEAAYVVDELRADLALALDLLDGFVPSAPCWQHRDGEDECSIARAQALLTGHGLRP